MDCSFLEFVDNQDVLDKKPGGMVALLDRVCIVYKSLLQWHSFEAVKTKSSDEAKKHFSDGIHFVEDHHVPSLPPIVPPVSKSRVPIARKKLDLAIYTFANCEELKEPHEALRVPGNGSFPVHGHQYIWNNGNAYHHHFADPMIWGTSPSFTNNVPSHHPSQMHWFPGAPSHMLSIVLPLHPHHVGSAHSANPSLWERRQPYIGDSTDTSTFHPGSLRSMGFSGGSHMHHLLELAHHSISQFGGNCIDHVGISSPQHRCHMFQGRNHVILMPVSFDVPNDRIRHKQEITTAAVAAPTTIDSWGQREFGSIWDYISLGHGHVLFDPGSTSSERLKIKLSCQRRIGKQRMWDHTFPQAEFAKDGLNSRRVHFEEGWTDAGAKILDEENRSCDEDIKQSRAQEARNWCASAYQSMTWKKTGFFACLVNQAPCWSTRQTTLRSAGCGRPLSGRPTPLLVDQTGESGIWSFTGFHLVDQDKSWSTRPTGCVSRWVF